MYTHGNNDAHNLSTLQGAGYHVAFSPTTLSASRSLRVHFPFSDLPCTRPTRGSTIPPSPLAIV